MSVAILPPVSTLPDQYAILPSDGSISTLGRTLNVYNGQHQRVLSVSDNPQADTVTVREFKSATGALTGIDTNGAQQFHETSKRGVWGVGVEVLSVDGYHIDIAAKSESDHDLFGIPTFWATSAPQDHVSVSVESDKAGTVTMNSVAGESSISASYSAPARQSFDLLKPSTWLSWL